MPIPIVAGLWAILQGAIRVAISRVVASTGVNLLTRGLLRSIIMNTWRRTAFMGTSNRLITFAGRAYIRYSVNAARYSRIISRVGSALKWLRRGMVFWKIARRLEDYIGQKSKSKVWNKVSGLLRNRTSEVAAPYIDKLVNPIYDDIDPIKFGDDLPTEGDDGIIGEEESAEGSTPAEDGAVEETLEDWQADTTEAAAPIMAEQEERGKDDSGKAVQSERGASDLSASDSVAEATAVDLSQIFQFPGRVLGERLLGPSQDAQEAALSGSGEEDTLIGQTDDTALSLLGVSEMGELSGYEELEDFAEAGSQVDFEEEDTEDDFCEL